METRRYVIGFRRKVFDQAAQEFPIRYAIVEAHDARDAVVFAEARVFGGSNGAAPMSNWQREEFVLGEARLAREDERVYGGVLV